MACLVRWKQGYIRRDEVVGIEVEDPVDYNHTKSGNIRRGHMFGYALCKWHHAAHPMLGTHNLTRHRYGPSLMDGGKLFHEAFGTDQELIDLQTITIEGEF